MSSSGSTESLDPCDASSKIVSHMATPSRLRGTPPTETLRGRPMSSCAENASLWDADRERPATNESLSSLSNIIVCSSVLLTCRLDALTSTSSREDRNSLPPAIAIAPGADITSRGGGGGIVLALALGESTSTSFVVSIINDGTPLGCMRLVALGTALGGVALGPTSNTFRACLATKEHTKQC